jgi:hypothetical protein
MIFILDISQPHNINNRNILLATTTARNAATEVYNSYMIRGSPSRFAAKAALNTAIMGIHDFTPLRMKSTMILRTN